MMSASRSPRASSYVVSTRDARNRGVDPELAAQLQALPAFSGVVTVPAVGGVCPESAAFVTKALGLGESGPPLDVERYVREEVCRGAEHGDELGKCAARP